MGAAPPPPAGVGPLAAVPAPQQLRGGRQERPAARHRLRRERRREVRVARCQRQQRPVHGTQVGTPQELLGMGGRDGDDGEGASTPDVTWSGGHKNKNFKNPPFAFLNSNDVRA